MIAGQHPDVTEIEAGSYLTMDSKYENIEGVGETFKTALSVLTTIISIPSNDRIIIDAGLKSISKDFGMPFSKNNREI